MIKSFVFSIMSFVFSVMAGLIVDMVFMLFSIYNGLKISENEAYRLMYFPLINIWVCNKKEFW